MQHRLGAGLTLGAFLITALLSAEVIDSGSASDRSFSGGDPWTVTGSVADKTMRFGAFQYHLPVSTGSYTVILNFLEPNQTAPGARVFSVWINDVLVVDQLDLVATAGLLPYQRFARADSRAGFLDIRFLAQVRSAVVSSIEIVQLATPVKTGPGIVSSDYNGQQELSIDKSMLFHFLNPATPPVVGGDCEDAGGVVVTATAVFFCAAVLPSTPDPHPWGKWIQIATGPQIATHPSGLTRVELGSAKYVCEPAKPEWMAVPGWVTQ